MFHSLYVQSTVSFFKLVKIGRELKLKRTHLSFATPLWSASTAPLLIHWYKRTHKPLNLNFNSLVDNSGKPAKILIMGNKI